MVKQAKTDPVELHAEESLQHGDRILVSEGEQCKDTPVAVTSVLIGKRLTGIKPMTAREMRELYWRGCSPPLVLTFEGGYRLFASQDEEGNGPGTFFVNDAAGCTFQLVHKMSK
jgi:hypothetical protein